jgi:hypothetical protein
VLNVYMIYGKEVMIVSLHIKCGKIEEVKTVLLPVTICLISD